MIVDGQRSHLVFPGTNVFKFIQFSPKESHSLYVAKPDDASNREYIVINEQKHGPFERVVGAYFTAENALSAIVLENDVVVRLEWKLE